MASGCGSRKLSPTTCQSRTREACAALRLALSTRADQNLLPEDKKFSAGDIGLSHKDIHEARKFRDAERESPRHYPPTAFWLHSCRIFPGKDGTMITCRPHTGGILTAGQRRAGPLPTARSAHQNAVPTHGARPRVRSIAEVRLGDPARASISSCFSFPVGRLAPRRGFGPGAFPIGRPIL